MNETQWPTNGEPIDDSLGAVIYIVVTILFYSLSLVCGLVLNIDRNEHFYENKWHVYQVDTQKLPSESCRTDALSEWTRRTSADRVRVRFFRSSV
jgi:hypothetical protein